jgi:hypothetical protein
VRERGATIGLIPESTASWSQRAAFELGSNLSGVVFLGHTGKATGLSRLVLDMDQTSAPLHRVKALARLYSLPRSPGQAAIARSF